MTILKSGVFTVVNILAVVTCIPKLGPALYDPLVFEAQNSLKTDDAPEDDWLTAILRTNDPTDLLKKPCQGYDYDVTICKFVNDRMICGYNKNKGEPQTEETRDMGNGCRMRNKRVECGYIIGPFNNPRRPPASEYKTDSTLIQKLRTATKTSKKDKGKTVKASYTRSIFNLEDLINDDDIEVRTKRNLNESTSVINYSKTTNTTSSAITEANKENIKPREKYCVDKIDNIFCYTTT